MSETDFDFYRLFKFLHVIAAMGLGHADDDFAALIEPLQNAGGTEL